MNAKSERLSDHLKATRNRISEFRHGGVFFGDDDVEHLVRRFDTFVQKAEALEILLQASDWGARAKIERAELLTPASAVVLETMRPESNVVFLRRPDTSSPFNGDDAA